MAFTTKDFPNQTFSSIAEYKEASIRRAAAEESIQKYQHAEHAPIVATILPVPQNILEKRMAVLESDIEVLRTYIRDLTSGGVCSDYGDTNFEGAVIGTTLYGTTHGKQFTLEPMKSGYLCSDGRIYESLSGAALGVSGNRRSGWVFWRDSRGVTIGELTGRHQKREENGTV